MTIDRQELDTLCKLLEMRKTEEQRVKTERIRIENAIAGMVATKDEGTDKAESISFVITVTSKLTRKIDHEAYLAIESGLLEQCRCVDLKPELNMKKFRVLEQIDPDIIPHFITSKPAKATVKIEGK